MSKKILINGCSFSQSQLHDKYRQWVPYSDLILEDYPNYTIDNKATSSWGNSQIINTLVETIEFDYTPDFVILQLSAFTRFMNHNLRDFWFSVLGSKTYSDLDMKTLAYSEDFLKIKDEHHANHLTDANYGKERYDVNQISSMYSTLTNETYLNNFVKIKTVIEYLKNKDIPHIIFFGWQQVDNNTTWGNKFSKLTNSCNTFWSPTSLGGLTEWGLELYKESEVYVSKTDFHPSSLVHEAFYKKIIKPKLNILQ